MTKIKEGGVIQKLVTVGNGRIYVATIKEPEKGREAVIKAWVDSPEAANWAEGVILGEFEIEKLPSKFTGQDEWWAKKHPGGAKGSRGGGGVAKSDPAKNQTIADANKRNNDTVNEASKRKAAAELVVALIHHNEAVIAANCQAGLQKEKAEKLTINELRNWFADCLDIVSEVNGS